MCHFFWSIQSPREEHVHNYSYVVFRYVHIKLVGYANLHFVEVSYPYWYSVLKHGAA